MLYWRYIKMNDELFVKELKILWENSDNKTRDKFADILYNYFGGERSRHIIDYLQMRVLND